MICRSCGTAIDDNLATCPECGAEPFARQRRQRLAESGAAKQYHEMMKAGADGSAPARATVRDDASASAPSRAQKTRNASERPGLRSAAERPAAQPQAGSAKRTGSMPPSRGARDANIPVAGKRAAPPEARMLKRHEYQAIVPEGADNFNWLRMLVVSAVCVLILTVGTYLFLTRADMGQIWLASLGREATLEAYHAVGKQYMANGSISRAVRALEIAQSKDPDNLEVLIDLGKAYMGNNQEDRAVLAYTRAIHAYPAYPEPYQHVIDILLERGQNYQAIQLVQIALDKTEDSRFAAMLTRLLPTAPSVSLQGKRYNKEIDLELSTMEENATIYYTLLDEDPILEGVKYEGPIHLEESTWRLRAIVEKDGMYSRETVQTYTIIKDQPDMPKTNLSRGTYTAGTTVKLRGGKDVIAIYYTVDGTRPTTDSKLFNEEQPIVLAIGKTTVRAIAVNVDGKESNELNITYEGSGSPKSSMSEKDTVGGLTLYKTTRAQFMEKYGQPQSETPDGTDKYGAYEKLIYPFGYATFVKRTPESEPLLAELSTSSSAFTGPRNTGIGTRMDDVLAVFRDHLGEPNMNGDRVLYNRTTGQSGFLKKVSDTEYKISYYHKLENSQHIELTYYIKDDLVTRMEWLQY